MRAAARSRRWLKLRQQEEQVCNRVGARESCRANCHWRRLGAATQHRMAEEDKKPNLKDEQVIGNGSFGVVFKATMADTGEVVAVKKVLQDKRFKVSESGDAAAAAGLLRQLCRRLLISLRYWHIYLCARSLTHTHACTPCAFSL